MDDVFFCFFVVFYKNRKYNFFDFFVCFSEFVDWDIYESLGKFKKVVEIC